MAFQQVKPHCVAFLHHVQLADPKNARALPGILAGLETCLEDLDRRYHGAHRDVQGHNNNSSNNNRLSSYIFFPFSQFLQLNSPSVLRASPVNQAAFDAVLHALARLAAFSRHAGNSSLALDKQVLEQLWTFVGLTLGGPLGSKNYQDAWNEPVKRGLVQLWTVILQSQRQDSALDLELPGSIVAHTLNTVLLILEDKTIEPDTRLATLGLLTSFTRDYLEPGDKIPQYLPGIVSTLSKVILAHSGSGRVATVALEALLAAIRGSINETRCIALDLYDEVSDAEPPAATSLEDLFASRLVTDLARPPPAESSALDTHTTTSPFGASTSPSTPAEPGHSKTWLRATSSQLQRAFLSIFPTLRFHQNPEVRRSLAELAYTLLESSFCSLTPISSRMLLEELLVCSCDDWTQVSEPSNAHLRSLIPASGGTGEKGSIATLLGQIGKEAITSLPHTILSKGTANEQAFQRQLYLVLGVIRLSGTDLEARSLRIERWSLNLLRALELAPIAGSSGSKHRGGDVTTAWTRSDPSRLLLLENGIDVESDHLLQGAPVSEINGEEPSKPALPSFPVLRLTNVALGKSTTLLAQAFQSLGTIGDSDILIEHFLGLAGFADTGVPVGGTSTVASALWVVQQLLQGRFHESTNMTAVRPMARLLDDSVGVSLSWLNRDDIEDLEEIVREQHASETATGNEKSEEHESRPEDSSYLGRVTLHGLLNDDSANAVSRPSKRKQRPMYGLQIHCLALKVLATSAGLVGPPYQKHMMRLLYPVLRASCPSSDSGVGLLQTSAYCTLAHIARYLEYDSPAQLLFQNVDYLLNSISAHLRGTTTLSSGAVDPLAPSVLVAAIELTGEDVLSHLGDAVEEIFDALDRWHAYDLLVSELLRVLDKLVSVCRVKTDDSPVTSGGGRAVQEVQSMQPDPEKDLQAFEDWFATRHDRPARNDTALRVDDLPDDNPEKPFANLQESVDASEEDDAQGADDNEEGNADEPEKVPATSSQVLVLAILRKAFYFLSHPSPFLRARTVALLASSVPVLAERTADLMPEINRFWPYILARLDDGLEKSPAYVLLEIMKLLIALMKFRGDFMNKRIVQDVLPKLQTIVKNHKLRNTVKNLYSDEHRTLKAMLELVTIALQEVPGIGSDEIWSMAVLFRPFLAGGTQELLRTQAVQLYGALGKLDPDLVWLVLSSGLGKIPDLAVLTMESWSYDDSHVQKVLDTL